MAIGFFLSLSLWFVRVFLFRCCCFCRMSEKWYEIAKQMEKNVTMKLSFEFSSVQLESGMTLLRERDNFAQPKLFKLFKKR